MKELIRQILFLFLPAEMEANEGTLKFRFLRWLYGEDAMEPMFDVIYPPEEVE